MVDDEPQVREFCSASLRAEGYQTLTARDGQEGLEMFQEQGDRIFCVLLDMVMPRMDGRECLGELRRLRSGLPVILMSGFPEEEIERRFENLRVTAILPKPFPRASLLEAVQGCRNPQPGGLIRKFAPPPDQTFLPRASRIKVANILRFKGLAATPARPNSPCLFRGDVLGISSAHNDGNILPQAPHPGAEFQARKPRHPQIGDDQVEGSRVAVEGGQGHLAGSQHGHRVPQLAQEALGQVREQGIVVHEEDGFFAPKHRQVGYHGRRVPAPPLPAAEE